jgi:hypothetical protein
VIARVWNSRFTVALPRYLAKVERALRRSAPRAGCYAYVPAKKRPKPARTVRLPKSTELTEPLLLN